MTCPDSTSPLHCSLASADNAAFSQTSLRTPYVGRTAQLIGGKCLISCRINGVPTEMLLEEEWEGSG